MIKIHRRRFLLASAVSSLPIARMKGYDAISDPWAKSELIEPAEFVKWLGVREKLVHIIYVGFPALYRQKHIPRAQLAGPTNKPEGISALRSALSGLARNEEIVIYCGCCPMHKCPNIRPAYLVLRELGFERPRILDLPTNFHTDWVAKGYPVET